MEFVTKNKGHKEKKLTRLKIRSCGREWCDVGSVGISWEIIRSPLDFLLLLQQ